MRKILILCGVVFGLALPIHLAAEEAEAKVFRESYNQGFVEVWKAVLKVMQSQGCDVESKKQSQDEKSNLFRGNVRSVACVFAQGSDTTYDVLSRYGKVPIIRGGTWVSGRIQYRIILKETEADAKTDLVLTAELSGREDYVTGQVHFWNSNGLLEEQFIAQLNTELGHKPTTQPAEAPKTEEPGPH